MKKIPRWKQLPIDNFFEGIDRCVSTAYTVANSRTVIAISTKSCFSTDDAFKPFIIKL